MVYITILHRISNIIADHLSRLYLKDNEVFFARLRSKIFKIRKNLKRLQKKTHNALHYPEQKFKMFQKIIPYTIPDITTKYYLILALQDLQLSFWTNDQNKIIFGKCPKNIALVKCQRVKIFHKNIPWYALSICGEHSLNLNLKDNKISFAVFDKKCKNIPFF